jgi:hypothetical protein
MKMAEPLEHYRTSFMLSKHFWELIDIHQRLDPVPETYFFGVDITDVTTDFIEDFLYALYQ